MLLCPLHYPSLTSALLWWFISTILWQIPGSGRFQLFSKIATTDCRVVWAIRVSNLSSSCVTDDWNVFSTSGQIIWLFTMSFGVAWPSVKLPNLVSAQSGLLPSRLGNRSLFSHKFRLVLSDNLPRRWTTIFPLLAGPDALDCQSEPPVWGMTCSTS